MNNLYTLIREALEHRLDDCNCQNDKTSAPLINESKITKAPISENLRYHVDNKIPVTENIFRAGSKAHISLILETRVLHELKVITLSGKDKWLFENTDLGKYDDFDGEIVPLDFPLIMESELNEEDKKKKNPPLNKPKRGGSKKFYVYVKDPKTKRIKKISFGDTTGLSAKINNSKARQAFSKRHNCPNKKDKTKAGYWACRLPRYSKLLGLKSSFSGFW
jgi:hypothetical protein